MNVTSTQFQAHKAPIQNREEAAEGSTFGIDIDPVGDAKDAISDSFETAGHFLKGACPVVGLKAHAQNSFFGSQTTEGTAGMVLNTVGTVGALVAAGQVAFGADPTIAAVLSAGTLIGSGMVYAHTEG